MSNCGDYEGKRYDFKCWEQVFRFDEIHFDGVFSMAMTISTDIQFDGNNDDDREIPRIIVGCATWMENGQDRKWSSHHPFKIASSTQSSSLSLSLGSQTPSQNLYIPRSFSIPIILFFCPHILYSCYFASFILTFVVVNFISINFGLHYFVNYNNRAGTKISEHDTGAIGDIIKVRMANDRVAVMNDWFARWRLRCDCSTTNIIG